MRSHSVLKSENQEVLVRLHDSKTMELAMNLTEID